MAADGDCHHLCKLMAPVRHRWSISDSIGEIRNTVMPSDCSAISHPVQHVLGGSSEERFSQYERVDSRRKKKCIKFADVMALLADEETRLRDMLLELNDSCEQYGMKINANKTKTMVIGRKIQKVHLLILNEAVEQVDSFKYLGCTTCVALYGAETWTLRRSEEKRIERFVMWIWRRMEHAKWTDRIRNEAVLERMSEERMVLKLIRKRERN
ncbi:hypothetical protein ANN_16343 [Periplaneta americana]|uniref:Reverse transcriptase domain-containing protein n=1 Tax=Periplaneta americana TaxID=6978 RepID=A0ABQ8SIQ8_PERAM|nr:hypothetical protein ANN_16343 [Periplaneta americana]